MTNDSKLTKICEQFHKMNQCDVCEFRSTDIGAFRVHVESYHDRGQSSKNEAMETDTNINEHENSKDDEKERLEEEEKEKKDEEIKQATNENEKQIRNNLKGSKGKSTENENFYSRNITELPQNIKHLVNKGDLQFLVRPDGACAPNAGAAHIFEDPKYGPEFRLKMNSHMADMWHFYKKQSVISICSTNWSCWGHCEV